MGRHKKIIETTTSENPPFTPAEGGKTTEQVNPADYDDLVEEITDAQTVQPFAVQEAGREVTAVSSRPAPARSQPEEYDELIETRLSQDVEQENSIKTVSKELFSKDSIEMKTEVTHDEINDITRLEFLAAKFGISNVDVLKNSFLRLRVSKNRKSRGEFIQSLQTENRNSNPAGGFLSKMFGGLGGGNSGGGNT